jgi:hypothetical protein
LEHRAGIEPANTGFADQRVSHFATGAHPAANGESLTEHTIDVENIVLRKNENPTSLTQRVGHLSFDSNASRL